MKDRRRAIEFRVVKVLLKRLEMRLHIDVCIFLFAFGNLGGAVHCLYMCARERKLNDAPSEIPHVHTPLPSG